ncbi:MAG: divergent polysaccharide deacetylase family protein [Gammaproteobacteria bacterium]|nr:MAG: divergent polysaccharide deacetylase family protein [Gammaproteobacteria bacterium]
MTDSVMKQSLALLGLLLLCRGVAAADSGMIERRKLLPTTAIESSPSAGPTTDRQPWIAIIIDDMGNQNADRQAVLLPGPVACSFLPHTPHAVELAQLAARRGKEVLLHQPMQSTGGNDLGPGALILEMDHPTFRATLSSNLAALPHVSGVNNHMGSLLTSHYQPMSWLMEELHRYPAIFFVDSRTTAFTVAYNAATDHQIPSTWRDIFLDNEADEEQISTQFKRLIQLAKRNGSAIAIGHPYPETLAFLQTHLPDLEQLGISLRPVSDVISLRKSVLRTAWYQASPLSALNGKQKQIQ